MKIVAIDQGTTSTKGVVVDENGHGQPLRGLRHAQFMPEPGWIEQDPRELLDNVRSLIELGAGSGAKGIALANQGETVVAWDRRTGAPLANAIVWQDQRTKAATDALIRDDRSDAVRARSGLPLDPYFSATKLRWLLDNVDGAGALARQGHLGIGTSDSYFIERLTGRYATDVTTASRTSLMNLDTCEWDHELCEIFDVPIELLPEIVADGEPIGTLATPSGSMSLLTSVVDQVAALYGHGCRAPGEGKISIGTGAFALVVTGFERPVGLRDSIIPTTAWTCRQGRVYAADGGIYTAAAAVEWLMRIGMLGSLDEVEVLSAPSAAERQVFFVPALAGLACPHWDRTAAGLFIGMDISTGREDMIKAVLEGVAFRIAEVIDALDFAAAPASISVDGGLSRSAYFTRFLANVSGRAIVGRGDAEVTALGAAALAQTVAERRDAASFHPTTQPPTAIEPAMGAQQAAELRARFATARERASGWRG
jgi:glycerol kinase